ncbi:MAG: chemotaxis protein CheX [bacterium]
MSSQTTLNGTTAKLLAAFCKSAEQVYETMVFTKVTCGLPLIKKEHFPCGAISGTIGITSSLFAGRLSLVFSQETAEKSFRSMMMMGDTDPVNESEMKDAVGELANMVAGGAKADLQAQGIDYVISLPTVVVGKDHCLESPKGCETMVIPAKIGDGEFFVEFAIS